MLHVYAPRRGRPYAHVDANRIRVHGRVRAGPDRARHGVSSCIQPSPCSSRASSAGLPSRPARPPRALCRPCLCLLALVPCPESTRFRKDAVSRDHWPANPYRVCESGPVDVHHS